MGGTHRYLNVRPQQHVDFDFLGRDNYIFILIFKMPKPNYKSIQKNVQ